MIYIHMLKSFYDLSPFDDLCRFVEQVADIRGKRASLV